MERLECRLDEALEAKESLRWRLMQVEIQSEAKQTADAEACDWLADRLGHTEDIEAKVEARLAMVRKKVQMSLRVSPLISSVTV